MAVDEATRHALFTRLEEVLGPAEAVCLMEHLPPVGWADVATKSDIALLKSDLVALEHRFGEHLEREIRKAITAQTIVQAVTLLGAVAMVRYG